MTLSLLPGDECGLLSYLGHLPGAISRKSEPSLGEALTHRCKALARMAIEKIR